MSYNTNDDNIYPPGMVVAAKVRPEVKLIIKKYYHRTYYCQVLDDLTEKHLAYFEKELIPPGKIKTGGERRIEIVR